MTPSALHDCYAVVTPGLEAVVAAELLQLGITPGATEPGGVAFQGDTRQLYSANLHLRAASRVIVRIAEFQAKTFFELERHARRVPWERWVHPGGAVHLRVTCRKSRLYHAGAVAQRLEKAAGEAVGAVAAGSAEDQQFIVRLFRDQCTISVDSSGELLHRRGYRQATTKAPLREILAAAMLLASGWNGEAPLLDPFCGSGTIPIEAALLARGIPPGLHRNFAFERWPQFEAAVWSSERDAVAERVRERAPVPILGSDRDRGAIESATANAVRAGVAADIEFRCCALSAIEPPVGPGSIVTNPPYGIRMGERLELRNLFAQFGNVLRKRAAGWTVVMLSADPMLEGQTGLALETRLQVTNGGIPVQVLSGTVGSKRSPRTSATGN